MADPYLQGFQGELDYLVQSLRWLAPATRDLEGLAYEVFLALHPAMACDDGPSPLRVQMFAAAYRVCCRHAGGRGQDLSASPLAIDIGGRGRKLAELEDPFTILQAALERIPLRCRAVLILHDIDGLPMVDVAGTLTMSRLVAGLCLRRARRIFARAVHRLSGRQPQRETGGSVGPEPAELLTAGQVIPREPEEVRARFVARAVAELEGRAESVRPDNVAVVSAAAFYLGLAACLAFAVGEAVAAVVWGRGN